MSDAFDDLGTAKSPFKVVACIPVLGRLPLLEHTIRRLYVKNGCYKVICAGHLPEDKQLCERLGAVWVNHVNKPLGAKWNAAFLKAKDYNPDACLYVGSSDFLSDQWLTIMKPHLDLHQMVGVPGMHVLDIGNEVRLCKWNGYVGVRADESIGIGRLLSKELLDKLHWQPFDSLKDNSLDRSMKDKARAAGTNDVMVRDDKLIALSLSTNLWVNKHIFQMHWDNIMPSTKIPDVEKFINEHFPEVKLLCESLKGTLVNR